jgi:uncharacterized damage-inducible protein DinB
MTFEDLRTLLDYHYWARDRMLEGVEKLTPEQFTRDLGSSFRSIRDTLAHAYFAEWAWYMRWQGQSPNSALPLDMFPDVASLRATWAEHEAKMRAFLESLGDAGVNRAFEFTMINGDPRRAVFWHMLQHVVNHGSYHRGQVVTMLRQLGAQPPESMDMVRFYRERQ